MQSYFETYILPILLGITTTLFIGFAKWQFFSILLPKYRQALFRGYDLSGTWESRFKSRANDNNQCHELIMARQSVDQVKGIIIYTEINPKNEIVQRKKFIFQGTFEDNILIAAYYNDSRHGKGRGTFCLQSIDADNMEGKYSLYDPDIRRIDATDYKWKRLSTKKEPPESINERNKCKDITDDFQ